MCHNVSCWNCEHSKGHRDFGSEGSYYEQPEPPMVEDCKANVPQSDGIKL